MAQSSTARVGQSILQIPYILRTRRNHALEHATIHVLSGRVRGLQMAGRSDASGFVLIGDVATDEVVQAVSDALSRLRGGQRNLAIHPNCGTNLVTTGYLTSLTALIVTRGANERESFLSRLPLLVIAMIGALLVSQPLGTWLQRHITTDGNPGNTEVLSINRRETNWFGRRVVLHRVETRSS
ncbi:MAG: DUF6391 domain-containing protein [Chloroflexota bacterium]